MSGSFAWARWGRCLEKSGKVRKKEDIVQNKLKFPYVLNKFYNRIE